MRSSSCYEMRYTVDNAPNMWNIPYNVIRRANGLIEAIDNKQVTDASESEIGQLYAEAKVVRALVHFDLVRIYGLPYTADEGASLGVPVMLKPLGSDELPTRNTVAEVYTQVVKDMTEAIGSGFMETKKNNGYITLWTAKALLSRVYMNMNKNKEALELAEDVINNSPYTLWQNSEYVDAWNKDNGAHTNEMLFEFINESSDDWGDREGIAYLYNEDGYADATLARIIIERRKELVGEGQRFFDAMRNNETVVRYTDETNKGFHYSLDPESQKFDRTYFRAILPIPASETDATPSIAKQQNPGY